MPRARNPQTTAAILDTAWRLFTTKGYDCSSYADIAAEVGVSRALVQKYFPKKETLVIKNLARLRHLANVHVMQNIPDAVTPLQREYLVSQIYIAALMSCNDARVFFRDVLRDRELTRTTIQSDARWTYGFLESNRQGLLFDEGVLEDSTAALGALYETMYYCIVTGHEMNLQRRLLPCLENMTRLAGCDAETSAAVEKNFTLSSEMLSEVGRSVFAKTLTTPWSDEFDD